MREVNKKILFIVNHRINRSPGQRFRFEQYIAYLTENGYECTISPLLTEEEDKIFYSKSNYFKKVLILIKAANKRFKDVKRANSFDIIFIFREAFFTGSTYFEKKFKKSTAKLVFDFDDAIWIHNVSDANKKFNFLKNPAKTGEIIKLCDIIFAGNNYLKNYALTYNSNIVIIPTTIDTEKYKRLTLPPRNKIVIGWSGSITTIQHFEYAIKFLKKIKLKYADKIEIQVIGDASYINQELEIKGKAWIEKTEINDLSQFDIGIMPLPNDEWARGKCGLKGLQYMALEIPTIMSPVGVNTEIITDGLNGFLALDEDEWVDKISLLIEDKNLREKMGLEGRKTVIDSYSVIAQQQNYLSNFNKLISKST